MADDAASPVVDQVEEFLPLRSTWFQMMLVLAGGVRHGYAIRREVEERTHGRVKLWPTTLYGALARMEEEGLIREVDEDPGPDDDIERNFYALTSLGQLVLGAETNRLEELVHLSRSRMSTAGS